MTSGLLILAVLLILSAMFSSSETALFSMSDIRLQTLAQQGDKKAALIQKLKADPKILLGTLLLGNNAVNVGASALATILTIRYFGDVWVGLAAGILTIVMIIFSEFVPKAWAAQNSERASRLVASPVNALTMICSPVIRILDKLVGFAIKKGDGDDQTRAISEDEIKTMAHMGVEEGTVEKGERELIERVFLFNDITAEDVMTPREDVKFLNGDWLLRDALTVINEEKYSRYPVFERDEDNILGIVHIKDMFERLAERPGDALDTVPVKDIVSQAMFVPETKPIDDLLREFQRHRLHVALVVNEYGSMAGLVTTDDLIEELVGEISDETDVEDNVIKRVDRQTIVVHGDEELKDINRFMNWKVPGPGNKTISRLILERLGDLPRPGERTMISDGIEATVEEMDNLRIVRVRLSTKRTDKPVDNTGA